MLRGALLAAAASALVVAPAASASTVRVAGDHLVLRAAPGERNDVVVTTGPFIDPGGVSGTGARIADAAGITPSGPAGRSGCVTVTATSVQCRSRGTLHADLGDRDDTLDASAYTGAVDVRGGSGNDTIEGGRGDDALNGGDGDDVISGGAGDDVTAGGPGHDVEQGGPGDDQLDELATGGDATAAAAGPDTLRGGPGDDRIDASTKGDRVAAGPGDDAVLAVEASGEDNHSRQVVDCGTGRDTVEVGSRDDITGCEHPFAEHVCSPGPRCALAWVERAGHRFVGRGATSRMLGLVMEIRIALNAAGRRLARRPGGVRIDVLERVRSDATHAPAQLALRGLRIHR